MKNTLETRLGIFAALIVLAGVAIVQLLGGVERWQKGYQLHALFNNIQDLKKGDRVKMAGVEIGRIEAIALTNNKVKVSFKVKQEVQIRTDSTAMVKFTGLMGQSFIAVDFGTPGASVLSGGDYVETAEQPDFGVVMQKIDAVAGGLQNLTKSFTGEKIDNLLGPFTEFLKANNVPLTVTFANLQAISSQISQGRGSMGRLIYDESLYNAALMSITNLQGAATEIRSTVTDARQAMDQAKDLVARVNAGEGTMGRLFRDDTIYRETAASMTNLREILQKINQGQGSAGKLVNDERLYKDARLTLQKLDKATEGLEDQGPLSIMGLIIGSLF